MPLLNYTPLAEPILISEVRAADAELRRVQEDLEELYPSGTLYFPFGFSDKRPSRAQQTYFVRMPREVLEVLGLELDHVGGPAPKARHSEGKTKKRGDSGYIADSVVRSAIEWRAVNLAIATYEADGYAVEYTGASKPYDLEATKGDDVRRVEVKGSSGAAATVELTHGEVDNSQSAVPTDLCVVDGIAWWRDADGSVTADGGEIRCWRDWVAEAASLKAIRFRYTLPAGGQVP